jgi:hypothetical protein
MEAKQLSLFRPVDRYLRGQPHQFLGGELWRVLAVDNGGDDIRRQAGEAQKAVDVVCGYAFLVGDNMHGQIGVLHQPFPDVVSPSNDPEQPWIGCRLLIAVIDKQSHSRPTRCSRAFTVNVRRFSDSFRFALLRCWFKALRTEQLDQPPGADIDLDAIRLDVDAVDKRHQQGPDLVGSHGHNLSCDLPATRDQALRVSAIRMFIANGIENRPLIRKEGAKPVDHLALEIAGGDAASL